nr:J domain-containing protein [uncultured Sphingosinicella sp.]
MAHLAYIRGLVAEGSALASAGKRETRFHGRVEGHRHCSRPGCTEAGEFRAPAQEGPRSGFDGPGDWRWLCLDHVREFNAGYNFFQGMSTEEIEAAQTPYGGWDRQTRAFAGNPSPPPAWADFTDPLDAIGARFKRQPRADGARHDGRELSATDRKSLGVMGLGTDADRRALRKRYAELLRRYHPDHNGGDRGHEKALQSVIEAYTQLKSRPAFAGSP